MYICCMCTIQRQITLNATDTFGKRPVFSLGVSQHADNHKPMNKIGLNKSSKIQENNERKTPQFHKLICVLSDAQLCPYSMAEVISII